jgi:hypothetical protein
VETKKESKDDESLTQRRQDAKLRGFIFGVYPLKSYLQNFKVPMTWLNTDQSCLQVRDLNGTKLP